MKGLPFSGKSVSGQESRVRFVEEEGSRRKTERKHVKDAEEVTGEEKEAGGKEDVDVWRR